MKRLVSLIFAALILVGCGETVGPRKFIPENPAVLDLDYAQNSERLPAPASVQNISGSAFKSRYFKIWFDDAPIRAEIDTFWGLNYAKGRHFDAAGRIYNDAVYKSIRTNANEEAFGLIFAPAITVKNALLRNIPSDLPIFGDPSEPGEGEPFDYAANSAVGVGYPMLLSHYSRDGAWAFVRNDGVWGWIRSDAIKRISPQQADIYANSKFITILREGAAIYDVNGAELFRARTGTILPYDFSGERDLGGTLGVRSGFGGEILTQFGGKRYFVSAEDARLWPAPLDEQNSKIVAASLLGQKYGWGGYKFLRDCSLLTKDFLANFGLWLPRNSKAQSGRGERFSLAGMNADEKLELIGKNGVAYKTLLYMPGHVMLYVGQVDGEPAVLHDIWGLRTIDGGRAVIGRTAITSLTIGSDRADIAEDRLLISRISAMSVLSGEDDGVLDDQFASADFGAN